MRAKFRNQQMLFDEKIIELLDIVFYRCYALQFKLVCNEENGPFFNCEYIDLYRTQFRIWYSRTTAINVYVSAISYIEPFQQKNCHLRCDYSAQTRWQSEKLRQYLRHHVPLRIYCPFEIKTVPIELCGILDVYAIQFFCYLHTTQAEVQIH